MDDRHSKAKALTEAGKKQFRLGSWIIAAPFIVLICAFLLTQVISFAMGQLGYQTISAFGDAFPIIYFIVGFLSLDIILSFVAIPICLVIGIVLMARARKAMNA